MSELYMRVGDLGIEPGSRVLDLGCGTRVGQMFRMDDVEITYANNSYPKGYTGDKFHLIDLNVDILPFVDDYFDFVVCAHVLEHLNTPVEVCRDIIRVGKRGFIGSPSLFAEIFWHWGDHRWILIPKNNNLYFVERTKNLIGDFGPFFHNACKGNREFESHRAKEHNLRILYNRFVWEGEFNPVYLADIEQLDDLLLGGKNERKV